MPPLIVNGRPFGEPPTLAGRVHPCHVAHLAGLLRATVDGRTDAVAAMSASNAPLNDEAAVTSAVTAVGQIAINTSDLNRVRGTGPTSPFPSAPVTPAHTLPSPQPASTGRSTSDDEPGRLAHVTLRSSQNAGPRSARRARRFTRDTLDVEPDEPTLVSLLRRCRRDHRAWINGDGRPYSLPDEGSIMGAVGGYGRGGQETLQRQVAVASQWTTGEGSVEFVNGGVDGGIAWLAMIERASVIMRGEATTRRWDLRVTEVFRRTGDDWERVHRHADPLVDRQGFFPLVAPMGNDLIAD